MILQATHTHLYPGCEGKISGLTQLAESEADPDCVVAFSDGSVAYASISKFENGWQLGTKPYRTAAGTEITEKLWLVRLQQQGADVAFRILKKETGG